MPIFAQPFAFDLNSSAEEFYDVAKAALPSWLFADDTAAQEILHAFAEQMRAARDTVDTWADVTFILKATGFWLDQHARDRGTRRATGEGDPALRARLRTPFDAVTKPALLGRAQALLTAAGVAGAPALMELRNDGANLTTWRAQVQLPSAAHILDGETWSVNAAGVTKVFEFDYNGSVAGGHIAVPLTVGWTDAQVAAALLAAINGDGAFTAAYLAPYTTALTVRYTADATKVCSASDTVADAALVTKTGHRRVYLGRGYRAAAQIPRIIVILPFGTPLAVSLAVLADLKLYCAGGVQVTVETRGVP